MSTLQRAALAAATPWLSHPNIVGLSFGEKSVAGAPTADRVLIVYVIAKHSREVLESRGDFVVPATIDVGVSDDVGAASTVSVPTDVVESGENVLQALDQRVRPANGGYRITPGGAGGTLGVNYTWGGRYRLITNNHVIARNGRMGAPVYQPADGEDNVIGVVSGFTPVTTYARRDQPDPVLNRFDLAWVDLDESMGSPIIHEVGVPAGIRAPVVGERIRLIGQRTGTVQRAAISDVQATFAGRFPDGGWAWFSDLIRLDARITEGGDSGAIYVAEDDDHIVGVNMGANDAFTFGCPLPPVPPG